MSARLRRRLRGESGFGLVELVISLVALNIALFALLASFTSGTMAINRASRTSTAGVLADAQMERYRAMSYVWVGLDTAVVTDAVYRGDPACVGGTSCSNKAPDTTNGAVDCRSGGAVFAAFPTNCAPMRTVSGAASPDGRTYRVDTYIREVTPAGSTRPSKVVTVVVRDPATANAVLARAESDFEYCTGLPDPQGALLAC